MPPVGGPGGGALAEGALRRLADRVRSGHHPGQQLAQTNAISGIRTGEPFRAAGPAA